MMPRGIQPVKRNYCLFCGSPFDEIKDYPDFTPIQAAIIETLARAKGRYVDIATLYDAVGSQAKDHNTIRVHILRLRRRYGKDIIITSKSYGGYRLGKIPEC